MSYTQQKLYIVECRPKGVVIINISVHNRGMHAVLRHFLLRTMCEFPYNGLQYKFLTLQPSVRFAGSPHLLHEKRPNAYLQWQKFHAKVALFTDKVRHKAVS